MVRRRRLALSEQEQASALSDLAWTVRVRRENLRLKQQDLADLADCSTRFIHMFEHAKPTIQMDKLLNVLNVLGYGLELKAGRGEVAVPGVTHNDGKASLFGIERR